MNGKPKQREPRSTIEYQNNDEADLEAIINEEDVIYYDEE